MRGVDRRPDDAAYFEAHRPTSAVLARQARLLDHGETRPTTGPDTRSRCRAVVVGAVLYTVAVTVLATWRGPGISPDSVAYASAAHQLTETGSLTMFDGGHLRFFPPGLPLTLAGLSLLGVPIGVAAILLNCLAASGTVLVTERIAVRATGSPVLAAACAATLAVSMGNVSTNAMLWTEPVVGLTTAIWILLLQRLYANAALTRADGVALALVITVSYAYRYAAIFMIAVTVVSVAVVYWRRGRARAVALSAVLGAGTMIGLAGLAVENARHGIAPLGHRAPSTLDATDVGWQVVTSLGALLINTAEAPLALTRAAGVVVVAAMVTLLVRAGGPMRLLRHPRIWRTSPLTPIVFATSAYWVFLVASELTTAINPIGYRLLYPILPAMIVLGVIGARALLIGSRHQIARRLWHIRPALFAAYLTVLACGGIGWAFTAADRGVGYNQVGLRDDAWVPVVRQLPADAGLISNGPYVAHWLTGREFHPSFGLAFYAAADPDGRARSLCSLVHEHSSTYLLWLGDATEGVEDFAGRGFSTTPVWIGADYSLHDVTGCYRVGG